MSRLCAVQQDFAEWVLIRNYCAFQPFQCAAGHTLRMLQLPSAWSDFISESTHGASCLGQLSGLESKKAVYKKAVETLADAKRTTLLLVTRPEEAPIKEARRASAELSELGIRNQALIINGMLSEYDDELSEMLFCKQQTALDGMPEELKTLTQYKIPLRAYNITGIDHVRAMLTEDKYVQTDEKSGKTNFSPLTRL